MQKTNKIVIITMVMMILAVSLSGCVNTAATSRVALVRPSDSDTTKWAISAKADSSGLNDTISIIINDEKVAEGVLSVMSAQKNISGTYQGKTIDAECSAQMGVSLMAGHKCIIYIDSKKVTELSF